MCTVCLINAGVERVVVATADPPSGTLELSRFRRLPPVWSNLAAASGLEVVFCQSNDASDDTTFLPAELQRALLEIFERSRTELDALLGTSGVVDFPRASANAQHYLSGK